LVLKFGRRWKYEKYVTVQTQVVSIIVMYLFNYICVCYLLVLTNAHIILIYISYSIYIFFFNFLLVHTKGLKTHSDKLVPTMLCMCMYSIARTNLLQWVLIYLVVRSMMMATRQNMPETDKVNKKYTRVSQ
jgi:hypothetical protein